MKNWNKQLFNAVAIVSHIRLSPGGKWSERSTSIGTTVDGALENRRISIRIPSGVKWSIVCQHFEINEKRKTNDFSLLSSGQAIRWRKHFLRPIEKATNGDIKSLKRTQDECAVVRLMFIFTTYLTLLFDTREREERKCDTILRWVTQTWMPLVIEKTRARQGRFNATSTTLATQCCI